MGPGLLSDHSADLIRLIRARGVEFAYITGARKSTLRPFARAPHHDAGAMDPAAVEAGPGCDYEGGEPFPPRAPADVVAGDGAGGGDALWAR
eukprot:gene23160-18946_t